MQHLPKNTLAAFLLAIAGCQTSSMEAFLATPPVAPKQPKVLRSHGHERVDDYYWLNERDNPAVLTYLEAENEYTAATLRHTESLQEELFEEIKGRIKQDDSTVPAREGEFWYYTRYEDGKQYPIHCRRRGSPEGDEQVILDVNELAEGHEYFAARGLDVSPDGRLLAFGTDTQGRRIYTIRIKDLGTGEMLPDEIPEMTANVAWAADSRTLFYTRQDPQTLRSYQVYRHTLGADPASDPLVFEEQDETFYCYVTKTLSQKYLLIGSSHTLSNEFRFLRSDDPQGEFRVLQPRQRGLEYSVAHAGDRFYILTNHEAKNFRLMSAPVSAPGMANWTEVIPHREDVLLEDVDAFQDHMVLTERAQGLNRLRVRRWDGSGDHLIRFEEPAYDAYVGANREFETTRLRFVYSSMTTPRSVFEYGMDDRDRKLLKRDEVLGDFAPENYRTERLWVEARDGVKVPISLAYHKDTDPSAGPPLLLYAYGSYGASMDASFSATRLSLLDRGFVYAIAHVRGGEEMGRHWYEDGKLYHKKNTFTDFIDCGRALVEEGYTRPDRLYAQGGSAGGLLIGAVINMAPELFHGAVAQVPFVDVVTTMLDESIPLTTFEYDEWGNPNDRGYYDYMLSYSPYDNVGARAYPHLLVTTGLHDSQVQYWEPAKWVAKLRAMKTDENRLLLKTEMHAGHGGGSGRYRRYKEIALVYAFLLDLAGAAAS